MANTTTQNIKKPLISLDNYDIVSLNLQKMDALIVGISGEGFAHFRNMSDESQSWYLLTISQLSHEAVKAINDKGLNHG